MSFSSYRWLPLRKPILQYLDSKVKPFLNSSILNRNSFTKWFLNSDLSSCSKSFSTTITNSDTNLSQNSTTTTEGVRSFIVTTVGQDRPGIVHQLSSLIQKDLKGSILGSRMTTLEGDFAIIGRVMLPTKFTEQEVLSSIQRSFPEFLVSVRESRPIIATQPTELVWLEAEGPDQPGIVAALTSIFLKFGASVHDLQTESTNAPWAGYPSFHLQGYINFPKSASKQEFYESVEEFEKKLGFDVSLQQINRDEKKQNNKEEKKKVKQNS